MEGLLYYFLNNQDYIILHYGSEEHKQGHVQLFKKSQTFIML